MRIALFHPSFAQIGGAEILILDMTRATMMLGHQAQVITLDFHRDTWACFCDGIHVRVVPSTGIERAFDGFDLVIAHNPPAHVLLGASRFEGRKIWYCHEPSRTLYPERTCPNTVHALRTRRAFGLTTMGRVMAASLVSARIRRIVDPGFRRRTREDLHGVARLDGIWANSAFTASNVRAIYDREATVLHPAVPFPDTLPDRPKGPGLRILTISRLSGMKGVETIVRGLALHRKRGGRATLDIVGRGSQEPFLKAWIRALGVRDAVTLHGFLAADDLAQLRRRAHVFALLPGDEPFGMVFPESAAFGNLLVGPDHGGPAEVLAGGEYGFPIDAFDPKAFADCLDRIASLPAATAADMRRRTFDHFRDAYGLQGYPERLGRVLDEGTPATSPRP